MRNLEEALATRYFEHLDSDHDGLISRQDLRLSLMKLSIPPTQRLIEKIHHDLDINKDGKINYHDFLHFLRSKQPQSFQNPGKNHMEEMFDYWTKASSIDLGESMVIPDEIAQEKTGSSPWVIFVSGGIAGAISRTTTAPLDRLKIIFQANLGNQQKKIVKELKNIYKESGWRGFFLGNGTNVVKIVPETGVKFLAYDRFKHVFCRDYRTPRTFERLLSGACAGICSQLVVYPLEITKTRLALAPAGVYKGIFDCIEKTYTNEGGAIALYKGLQASLVGVVPYAAIDLAIYNTLRDNYILSNRKDPSPLILLACGAISSICGQVVSYPFAVIRTRLQSQGMLGVKAGLVYKGLADCARKIRKIEGIKGFYKGILPNFMKTVPAISISYVVFENVKTALGNKQKGRPV